MNLATVYFRLDDGEDRQKNILAALNRSKGFLRRELSKRVKLKYSPDLRFFFDDTLEVKNQMEELFQKIKRENKDEDNVEES